MACGYGAWRREPPDARHAAPGTREVYLGDELEVEEEIGQKPGFFEETRFLNCQLALNRALQ